MGVLLSQIRVSRQIEYDFKRKEQDVWAKVEKEQKERFETK